MTQVLFDLSYLDAFLDRTSAARSPIPLLVGIWPLPSLQLAVRIHNEVPGIVVPEHVQERLRDAGTDAADAGRELARELMAESREKAAGRLPGGAVPAAARHPRLLALAHARPGRDLAPAPAPASASRTTGVGTP